MEEGTGKHLHDAAIDFLDHVIDVDQRAPSPLRPPARVRLVRKDFASHPSGNPAALIVHHADRLSGSA